MIKDNKKIIIILAIVIIAVVTLIVTFIRMGKGSTTKTQEITEKDVEYYVLKKEDQYGVIDKLGNIIIEPKYIQVQIPNPTTDLFLCTTDTDIENIKWTAVNKEGQPVLTQYENIEALPINQQTSYVPYEKNILIYKENNYYGIINLKGDKITDAIYEEISGIDYKEGYLKVKKQNSYGVIDTKGKSIIKNEYDNIMADGFYDENTKYQKAGFITRIKTDDGYRFGYANEKGKKVLDTIYNELNRITEIKNDKDIYLVISTNGKYGLTKKGKVILEPEYTEISYDKNSNLLIVTKGNAIGVVDLKGKLILPIDYDFVAIGGDYITANKGETKLVFNTLGEQINTDISNHTTVSKEYSIIIDNDNYYNIVDNSNNKLLKDKYIYLEYFKDDMFIATKDAKTGIIKADESIVVPIKYGTIQKIEDTELLQAIDTQNSKIDLIDEKGKIIEGIEQAKIIKTDDYIKIYSNTDMKYFNLDGKVIYNRELFKGNSIFADCKNGKWGFLNSNGTNITNYEYDYATEQNGNVAGFKVGELWGIISKDGNIILEPTYKISTDSTPKFLGKFYESPRGLNVPIYVGE